MTQGKIGEVPKEVIMCCMGVIGKPEGFAGLDWCHKYGRCFTCAKEAGDALFDELARLKTDRDRALAELDRVTGEDVATLEEHGWMKLPVDADGEPIHVGDVMTYDDDTLPNKVIAIVSEAVFLVEDGPRYADMCHHFRKQNVKDVLRGVVTLCHNTWKKVSPCYFFDVDDVMESGIIEDFAAKLRLAGDAE